LVKKASEAKVACTHSQKGKDGTTSAYGAFKGYQGFIAVAMRIERKKNHQEDSREEKRGGAAVKTEV